MKPCSYIASLVLASLVSGAAPADAQTDAEIERARTLFREGLAFSAASNFAAALAKFEAVAQVKTTPQVAFNIAECQEKLGKLVAALGNYRLAQSNAAAGNAPEVEAAAPGRIAALEERIPRLVVRRGAGAESAAIALDGVELGAAQIGVPIPVDPGPHAVTASVRGRELSRRVVTLAEADEEAVGVVIDPARPGGEGPAGEGAPSGERSGGRSKVPGIVLTSVGTASLGAGIAFLVLRQGTVSDLDALCGGDTSCPASAEAEGQSLVDRGRLYTGLAEATLAVGVAGVATGIVLLVTARGDGAPKAARSAGPAKRGSGPALRVDAVTPRFGGGAEALPHGRSVAARGGGAGFHGVAIIGSF